MANVIRWFLTLYPVAKLLYVLGLGPQPIEYHLLGVDDDLCVNPNSHWKVIHKQKLSACDNRPGLKKIYVRVVDEKGEGLHRVKVRFGWESGEGMAYDHANIWGLTDEQGFIEWDHFGVPTRYMFWMEDDETPLIENIRTDLGYEYCNPGTWQPWAPGGWRPVNRPGIYSYRFVIERKGSEG